MSDHIPVDSTPDQDSRPYRQILVLHGGGYRGLYTARMLERLQEHIGTPILDSFDMVAGTSIGGIIALALSEGVEPETIRETIQKEGPSLFPAYGRVGRTLQFLKRLRQPPHQQEQLRRLIRGILTPDKALSTLDIHTIVPACDATGDAKGPRAVLYGNHTSNPQRNSRIEDVALATSAAPTYFASYQLPDDPRQLVDGGVIANSPSWIALTVALSEYGWDIQHLRMLIIGTTQSPAGRVPPSTEPLKGLARFRHPIQWGKSLFQDGLLYWVNKGRLLTLLMDGQQRLADGMCEQALNRGYCLSINSFRSPEQDKVASTLNQASTDATRTLMTLADNEFDAISKNKAIMQLLRRKAHRLTNP